MTQDKRAVQILTDTVWTSAGWRRDPHTAPDDFAYAKAHGVMFDPVRWTHNEVVDLALAACRGVSKQQVVAAFIASLGTRRLDLRSAIGSYAVGRHLERHAHNDSGICTVCGEYRAPESDLNVLAFERIKWGGVRHDKPSYIAFDLTRLAEATAVEPSPDDYRALGTILDTLRSSAKTSRLADLVKALGPALPSNVAERRTLVAILGFCGILIDGSRPDFRRRLVLWSEREPTPWSKDDWPYPVRWWTGACGVDEAAVAEWFPSASLAKRRLR